jgi:hypothetical protein
VVSLRPATGTMVLAIAAGFIGVGVRDLPRRVADPRNVRFSPEAKCRPQCQLFRPKRRGAGIGGVIPRPVESLPHAPVPAVPLPCAPGHLCPRLNAYVTVIVGKIVVQRSPQRSLIPHDHVVQALASEPTSRSAKRFCQGDRGAVSTSSIPIFQVMAVKSLP